MSKLYIGCCNCGHALGNASSGTQIELFCPKCGAELQYTVTEDCVEIQITGKFVDQQKLRIRRYARRYKRQ